MKKYKRVLIVQPYGIGDLLFLTPVFRALRRMPGMEKIGLLLGSRTEAVVAANPNIDIVYSINKDTWHREGKMKALKDLAGLTKKILREHYDLLLDYSLRGEYGFWAQFFWGIPVRAGFDYKSRGFFHNCKTRLPEGFSGKHVTDFFCDLAEKAGVPVPDRRLEFFTALQDREKALEILRSQNMGRYLVISAGGGESWGKDAHFKRWPPRYFARLAKQLTERYALQGSVVLGSAGENELAEELCSHLQGPYLNLCGEIPLGVSAALLQKASLFLGNDGGLMHLAHALEIPVIALFGPVDPAVYGPYPENAGAIACVKKDLACRPCYQKFRYHNACEHRDCLQSLTPEEVLDDLEEKKFNI